MRFENLNIKITVTKIILSTLVIFIISPQSVCAKPTTTYLGDYYYNRKEYQLARIEYERELLKNPANPALLSKLSLGLIRQKKFKIAINYLNRSDSFASLYLRLYANLRQNKTQAASFIHQKLEKDTSFTQLQKFHSRILAGSILLERGQYNKAVHYFEKVKQKSKNQTIIDTADQVLVSLNEYKKLDSKSAILAGIYSSIIPGSGQMYTEHYVDGGVALFFNTMFLGSAIIMYDLENQANRPHQASLITGLFGLGFYISNILGAYKSAHRYNIYQKRKLHQDIRMHFLNIDFVEKSSQIKFTEKF